MQEFLMLVSLLETIFVLTTSTENGLNYKENIWPTFHNTD